MAVGRDTGRFNSPIQALPNTTKAIRAAIEVICHSRMLGIMSLNIEDLYADATRRLAALGVRWAGPILTIIRRSPLVMLA